MASANFCPTPVDVWPTWSEFDAGVARSRPRCGRIRPKPHIWSKSMHILSKRGLHRAKFGPVSADHSLIPTPHEPRPRASPASIKRRCLTPCTPAVRGELSTARLPFLLVCVCDHVPMRIGASRRRGRPWARAFSASDCAPTISTSVQTNGRVCSTDPYHARRPTNLPANNSTPCSKRVCPRPPWLQ